MKMRSPTLKEIILLSFICLLGIILCSSWIASLIIPDWEYYIENPTVHNIVGWVLATLIGLLGFILLYFIVDLAIDRQIKDRKIQELELELNRLKKDD